LGGRYSSKERQIPGPRQKSKLADTGGKLRKDPPGIN